MNTINLLKGNIAKTLAKLAIPISASAFIRMAYNLTDTFWVNSIGVYAMAGVGSAGMFLWFSEGIMMLASVGGRILLGQSIGANQKENTKIYVQTTLQISIIIGVLLSLIGYLFAGPLLSIFNFNNPQTFELGLSYLKIVIFSTFFASLSGAFTALLTANGDSKTPFFATTVGLILNMILDPLLIFQFNWGVKGVALATLLAQIIVCVILIIRLRNYPLFQNINFFKWNKLATSHILRLSLPTAMQTLLFSSIAMVLARIITPFGDSAIGAQKIGVQIESISWMTAEGFASALNAFVAQNFGAKNYTRVHKGYLISFAIMSAIGFSVGMAFIFIPTTIFSLFTQDTLTLSIGSNYLYILGFSQWAMCIDIMTAGAFYGLGKTKLPSFISITLIALRIPLSLFLIQTSLGLSGVWWSLSITSILKGLLLLFFIHYEFKKWKKRSLI